MIERYESRSFRKIHEHILHLMPPPTARILDIGAGTGRDAAGFAEMGYDVVAVEPTVEFRRPAQRLHPSPRIQWIDDSLPDLAKLSIFAAAFHVVTMTDVWMHLDRHQRRQAMPNVARVVRNGGLLSLALRHGPIPEGRRMF
ncbi:MAG: class I SAM-dependent methyltransferase [Alphaproteobacteria bacterium]